MRCDQYIGLNEWANKMLEEDRIHGTLQQIFYPEGNNDDPNPKAIDLGHTVTSIPAHEIEVIGTIHGAWDDNVADLRRFTMSDGTVYEEFVQAKPWSSGPCYFIALKRFGMPVEKSLWTEEEINNA